MKIDQVIRLRCDIDFYETPWVCMYVCNVCVWVYLYEST